MMASIRGQKQIDFLIYVYVFVCKLAQWPSQLREHHKKDKTVI
jgi:hypothetical protein